MILISPSVDAFLLTSLVIVATTIWYLRRRHNEAAPDSPYSLYLSIFLLFHTLYIIYLLLLCWPPNLFQRLRIPLNAPPEAIRSVVLGWAGLAKNGSLPEALDTLLNRLSAFEMRTLYVRFGHTVVQNCEYCRTFEDYALFALPGALLEYIRGVMVLGLLTVADSGRERYRTYVVGVLIFAALVEGYVISSAIIHIPTNGVGAFMWHDNLWAFRQLLFLILPIITHSMPAARAREDPTLLVVAIRTTLEKVLLRVGTVRYTNEAILRDPELRASVSAWWDQRRVEGEWARSDEVVRRTAERLQRGFAEVDQEGNEGPLRKKAREAAQEMAKTLRSPTS